MSKPEIIRNGIGFVALGLVVVGVWGLWGWQWAAIATGLPVAVFYVWGEVRTVQHPPRHVHNSAEVE